MKTADPFDVAIVLGARVRPDGTPSAALERRVRHAVALAEAGRVRHLLLTGGAVGHPVPEAQVMRDLALELGVPADTIHVEDRSANTIENARFSVPILGSNGWTQAVVVTDAYHLRRALYVFRRQGLSVAGSGTMPPRPGLAWGLAFLREAAALPWTVLRVEWEILRRG